MNIDFMNSSPEAFCPGVYFVLVPRAQYTKASYCQVQMNNSNIARSGK